jgi:hypothetical protein
VFTYRLALALNIDQVEAWKRRLTVRQLKRWMAYWRVEPFGDEWRMAARQSLTVGAALGGKPDPGAEDRFLPSFREKPQTLEDIRRELSGIPVFAKQMESQ